MNSPDTTAIPAAGHLTADGLQAAIPRVVVAGRPNVGKSSLVNRFVGRRAAVVEERPGVTRDRLELLAEWNGRTFTIVDTGGWLEGGSPLDTKVAAQAERAMRDADLVLVVVDATVGVVEEDAAVARLVRRCGRPYLLVANKVDNTGRLAQTWELLALGLGDPIPVSALHGSGTGDLLDVILDRLPPAGGDGESGGPPEPASAGDPSLAGDGREGGDPSLAGDPAGVGEGRLTATDAAVQAAGPAPRVALIGRPNVGKSTLFNRLIGDDRSVVHDLPGTTRDAVDTLIETADGPMVFIDTAGMRRRSGSDSGADYYAVVRALQALDTADVAILVVDATEGVTRQDQRLAERIGAAGSPVVVALNKWEQLDAERRARLLIDVEDRLAFLGESPVLKLSALSGLGVHRIMPALRRAIEAYHRRVSTGELNRAIRAIQQAHPAPGARIRYAVQGAVDPPTFTLFANRRLPQTYLRYLERALRERFGMGATPIELRVRTGGR